jgi:hypothetical protein
MLRLEAKQVCHLKERCPHAPDCWGVRSDRDTVFTCSFVDENGNIREDAYRNPHDQTGKMQILHG